MLATGGLLVAIALLALAVVAPVFRRENPPRWTTRGWIEELVTVAIVCTLALGLGYLGAGVIAAFQAGLDLLDLGVLAGVVLVAIVIWRWLKARAEATSGPVAAAAGAPAPPPATG
jgi:ABC-type multidrug transport system permease subunit